MSKHEISELHQLQALSLNEKVERTKARIRQWVEYWGLDHVYLSFSGGKDSSVLLDIARSMYPEMKAVFLDTSLEFPELREFVNTFDNVEYLKPKMNFRQVIEKYGYPVISKEVSECVMGAKIYLTKLMEERESLRAEQSRAELPYAQFYRKLCGTGEYARNCAPESNSGGQKHIYSYECDRILGTIQEYKDSQVARGEITSLESSVDWDYIAKILENKGVGSGGSVLRLARLMGIYGNQNQIKANIPSKDRSQFSQERYKFLLTAPFNVSNRCCSVFKKNLSHQYNHKNDMHPILGSMASESRLRTQKWLENGCNGFDLKEPISNPMSFWCDNDVLEYIQEHNLKICKVYGDIVTDYRSQKQVEGQISFADMGLFDKKPILTTTGCLRTGCIACGFGLHLEKRPNRLELIDKVSNPKLRDFILRGGAFDESGLWKPDNRGLGFWFVLQYLNVHGNLNIFIPEYDRYEREYGTEETKLYLIRRDYGQE